MATLNDTAYPRLSRQIPYADLQRIYLPTPEEKRWLDKRKYPDAVKMEAAIMLKCFQRLGYFPTREQVPARLVTFISESVFGETYNDVSLHQRQSRRIKDTIRNYVGVKVFTRAAHEQWLYNFALTMAQTKESTVDIINAMIEQLVRDSFELPAFSTLNRIAIKARSSSLNSIYKNISSSLPRKSKRSLKQLLQDKTDDGNTLWNAIKLEPRKPSSNEIKYFIKHTQWLTQLQESIGLLPDIPEQIRLQCILEARAYSADRMSRLKTEKQESLMAIYINEQRLYANDCLVDMFLKEIRKSHNVARKALLVYQTKSSAESASLVTLLRDIALACTGTEADRDTLRNIRALLGNDPATVAERCDTLVQGGIDNYLYFLNIRYNKSNRKLLLDILETLDIQSIAKNNSLHACLKFILSHRQTAFYTINVKAIAETADLPASTLLSWVTRPWNKLLFSGETAHVKNRRVNSVWLELCVLTEVSRRLRSGDLYIRNSIKYDDYRTHLVDRKTLKRELDDFCEQTGLAPIASDFVANLKHEFQSTARELDARFKDDECAIFDNGRLSLKRPAKKQLPDGFEQLEAKLKGQIPDISIIDLLVDTVKWIDLKPYFNPLSGHQGKIRNFERRLVATLFCYGCNIGPTQTARCIDGFSRKQIAYVNLSNTSEQNLVDATEQVINAYNEFELPGFWGSGNTASVDGTRFDMYEQNMLSEYHVRYASYGGVGYYLVSDKYIALFSRFIPCGVREAVHLIDGLMENKSDIQPNAIHGDTHAQSTVVFGVAHLLGIKLLPRIKDINSLIFFKPDRRVNYEHIDELFSEGINFNLIRENYMEMLRVAVSIKLGKVSASTIIRRLGTEGIRNDLFYAFRELGRVVRTKYLLEYIGRIDLRETVNAATCKSEEFNNFLKWVFFYNNGIIQENFRHEQTKIVKYNHLVANLIILHNVNSMTKGIRKLQREGVEVSPEMLDGFSPYGTSHLNLLGQFDLNTRRRPKSRTFRLNA